MSVWCAQADSGAHSSKGQHGAGSNKRQRRKSSAAVSPSVTDTSTRRVDVDCSSVKAKKQHSILYAAFSSVHELVVARGTALRPQFETLVGVFLLFCFVFVFSFCRSPCSCISLPATRYLSLCCSALLSLSLSCMYPSCGRRRFPLPRRRPTGTLLLLRSSTS
jgi:hypothetical protein